MFAVLATGTPALAVSQSSSHPVQHLIEAVPSWAHGLPAALVKQTAPVQISLLLKGRNQAELRQFVAKVSDPASPSYRHFLTRAEYQRRFAPGAADVAAAKRWLRGAGFTVDTTTPNGSIVTAHATSALVGKVFDTTFGLFRVAGHLLRAPLSEPTLPAALRPLVATVIGLAQNPAVSNATPAPAYLNARPCSRYFGQKIAKRLPKYQGVHQPYAICGYRMGQLRSAYGVDRVASTGKGAKIAVVDAFASPTITADVNTWSRRMGLPGLRPGQLVQQTLPGMSSLPQLTPLGVPVLDPQGWQGEQSLDIEAVHGMAPGATIYYYAALSGFGLNVGPYEVGLEPLLVALAQAVESGAADLVSNSWGGANDNPTPGDTLVLDAITNQAAATGITINFSSGDSGDEVAASGVRVANFPATSTGVTAVGGTTLEVGKDGRRVRESYWGTQKVAGARGRWDVSKKTFSGAAGGGVSTAYPQPSWQKGIVPAGEATYGGLKTPGRVEPDLSMVADSTTGMLIGYTQHFPDGTDRYGEYRIGGTSLSCPLLTGLLALAVAQGHHRLGLITPTLYAKSRTAAGRARLFYDPVAIPRKHGRSTLANVRPDYAKDGDVHSGVGYTLRILSNLGTLHARRGFDDSTGLGTPRAPALVAALR
jgi:subtilase family serine protease